MASEPTAADLAKAQELICDRLEAASRRAIGYGPHSLTATDQEIARIARALADAREEGREGLIREVKAGQAHARVKCGYDPSAPPGHVIDDQGVVRKVNDPKCEAFSQGWIRGTSALASTYGLAACGEVGKFAKLVPLWNDNAKCWGPTIIDCTIAEPASRKVLGTLPVTADEVVCGIGAIVYTEGGAEWQACVHNDAHEPSQCEGGDPSTPLHQCYSTREAAEAARKAPQ